jgi:chromate transporter
MQITNTMESPEMTGGHSRSSPLTIFLSFLRLGCTSFGGPIAHLGYFRNEFVLRRKWLDESAYADIVGLCQFLPGPASSQVGFTIGLLESGPLGGFAAWAGFTLPSAVLMLAFAYGHVLFAGGVGVGIVHGLELVAVAVIAQAAFGMVRALAPDRIRGTIVVLGAGVVLLSGHALGQLAAIVAGALIGLLFTKDTNAPAPQHLRVTVSRTVALTSLVLFALLLVIPTILLALAPNRPVLLFQAFYRTGALVFGGGHVVLPLLQSATVNTGWVDNDIFLAGYGVAQALPGPLFTFAAYLGAVMKSEPHGAAGAVVALFGIFLPGLLLVLGVLPFWNQLRLNAPTRALFAGINASVVGILLAALYQPVWTSTVHKPSDFVLVLAAYVALTIGKAPPWAVVCATAAIGGVVTFLR